MEETFTKFTTPSRAQPPPPRGARQVVAAHLAAEEGSLKSLAEITRIFREQREQRRRENAAYKAKAEARAAQEKAQEEADRAAWIEAHGSPRLKRLAAEGIEYMATYRDERLAIERPDWEWKPRNLYLSEPRNAPLEAIALLDEARKTESSCKLSYYKVYRKAEDIEDEYYDYGEANDDGEVVVERGYCASTEYLTYSIISKARHKLPVG